MTASHSRLYVRLFIAIALPIFFLTFFWVELNARANGLDVFKDRTTITTTNNHQTSSHDWGDLDGDGLLDVVYGTDNVDQIYQPLNLAADRFEASWTSLKADVTRDIELGDVDGDGDLDIFLANDDKNALYINKNGAFDKSPNWSSTDSVPTAAIDWGDLNGDGWLDVVAANNGVSNTIYINDEGDFKDDRKHFSFDDSFQSVGVSLGDIDSDGDLDIAFANSNGPDQLFINSSGVFTTTPAWESSQSDVSNEVAWGDVDADGDLDLAVAIHGANKLYLNEGGVLNSAADWVSADAYQSNSVAWIDADLDGDLDLLIGNEREVVNGAVLKFPNSLYENVNGTLSTTGQQVSADNDITIDVHSVDANGDGAADISTANWFNNDQLYLNTTHAFQQSASWESPASVLSTNDSTLGDINRDGYLDLILANDGKNLIFLGLNSGFFEDTPAWETQSANISYAVALADMDGDIDLDLAVANNGKSKVYENINGILSTSPIWESATADTYDIAWADVDGDGDLDLTSGNYFGPITIYKNENGALQTSPNWVSEQENRSRQIVWADIDNDGDQDLISAEWNLPNKIYLNNNGDLLKQPVWQTPGPESSNSVAVSDVNQDGYIDLVFGNDQDINQLYINNGDNTFSLSTTWEGGSNQSTQELTFADIDGDRDQDLVEATTTELRFFRNQGNILSNTAVSFGGESGAKGLAAADIDRDGKMDIATTTVDGSLSIFSTAAQPNDLPNQFPKIELIQNDPNHSLIFGEPVSSQIISIPFKLTDAENDPAGTVRGYYSLDGGSRWLPATPAKSFEHSHFKTDGSIYIFPWDTFASGIFGRVESVRFRLEASTRPATELDIENGTYSYVNSKGKPSIPAPFNSESTEIFRLQGAQVQVFEGTPEQGNEVSDAIVMRISSNSGGKADLIEFNGEPFRTNESGYLSGRGKLGLGDQLIALSKRPLPSFPQIEYYKTSAPVTTEGIDFDTVEEAGIQKLTISDENNLLLVNLIVSLEWDARKDEILLQQLESALQRTSDIFFDATNGQMALGKIVVFHDQGHWGNADIVIRASNKIRPAAGIGGIVLTPTTEILTPHPSVATTIGGQDGTIESTYIPSQIQMPIRWGRFGTVQPNLGEDWAKTLAHELGHYVLFLPDNYIGLDENFLPSPTTCEGSLMDDPYKEDNSEFIDAGDSWNTHCPQTLSALYFNRSDWETIKTHYPMLNSPTDLGSENSGPNQQPLNLVDVQFSAPPTETMTINSWLFDIKDQDGKVVSIPDRNVETYLVKNVNDASASNDQIIELGATTLNGLQVEAWGAEPGDRVCLYDYGREPKRFGCESIEEFFPTDITLLPVEDFQPTVKFTPISTESLQVEISNTNATQLKLQLHPDLGRSSEILTVNASEQGTFSTVLTAPDGAYYGHIRIETEGQNGPIEILIPFSMSAEWQGKLVNWGVEGAPWQGKLVNWGGKLVNWGGKLVNWGAKSINWGTNSINWGAPTLSPDGHVSVLPTKSLFDTNQAYSIMRLVGYEELSPYLTPVGQAYQLSRVDDSETQATIFFNYLSADIRGGDLNEAYLAAYYLDTNTSNHIWRRLDSTVDSERNLVSAQMEGSGVYILALARPIETLYANRWNQLSYPNEQRQLSVSDALSEFEGKYQTVFSRSVGPNAITWDVFDKTIEPPFHEFVNTLTHLKTETYWIYMLEEATSPYIPVDYPTRSVQSLSSSSPPMMIYGWVDLGETHSYLQPTITAEINGNKCGAAEVIKIDSKWAYKLQIFNNNDPSQSQYQCSNLNNQVRIFLNGEAVYQESWTNTAIKKVDLSSADTINQVFELYLSIILR